jgi:methylmalonic aciduria homocystinuria type C protein
VHRFDAGPVLREVGLARLVDPARPVGILVGNTRALWEPFRAARRANATLAASSDPIEQFTEAVVGADAAARDATVFYSHAQYDGAYLPFQRLAVAAGFAALAPTHLLVHPTYGPWFALRAIVLISDNTNRGPTPISAHDVQRGPTPVSLFLDVQRGPTPVSAHVLISDNTNRGPTPIFAHDVQRGPTPISAHRVASVAIEPPCTCDASCLAMFEAAIAAGNGPESWRAGLAVRDACPVGREFRYSDAQLAYHYTQDARFLG